MSLLDALFLEPYRDPHEVWIALRSDGQRGSGTIDDPYDGSTRNYPAIAVTTLTKASSVATAVTSSNHGFATGDMVTIRGVATGVASDRVYTHFTPPQSEESPYSTGLRPLFLCSFVAIHL